MHGGEQTLLDRSASRRWQAAGWLLRSVSFGDVIAGWGFTGANPVCVFDGDGVGLRHRQQLAGSGHALNFVRLASISRVQCVVIVVIVGQAAGSASSLARAPSGASGCASCG